MPFWNDETKLVSQLAHSAANIEHGRPLPPPQDETVKRAIEKFNQLVDQQVLQAKDDNFCSLPDPDQSTQFDDDELRAKLAQMEARNAILSRIEQGLLVYHNARAAAIRDNVLRRSDNQVDSNLNENEQQYKQRYQALLTRYSVQTGGISLGMPEQDKGLVTAVGLQDYGEVELFDGTFVNIQKHNWYDMDYETAHRLSTIGVVKIGVLS